MADEDKPKPFVSKLWGMVTDPANHDYIRWMPGGKSIQVVDRSELEKKVLPKFFKHARFSSFVRQLNMYGWHKVQDYGTLSGGSASAPNDEHWQFENPDFQQGREDLLVNIKRHKGPTTATNGALVKREHGSEDEDDSAPPASGNEDHQTLQRVLRELEQIRAKQLSIGEDLGRMRRENETLWSEYYQTRERYDKHSQMLGRILRFLAGVYGQQFGSVARSSLPVVTESPPAIRELQELQELHDSDCPVPTSTASASPNAAKPGTALVPRRQSAIPRVNNPLASFPAGNQIGESPLIQPLLLSETDTGKQLVRRGVSADDVDTAAQLFPELQALDTYAQNGNHPPVTPLSQSDLDNIARELNNQGDNLQSIHNWLLSQQPSSLNSIQPAAGNGANTDRSDEGLLDFNVDDFLVDTPPPSVDAVASGAATDTNSERLQPVVSPTLTANDSASATSTTSHANTPLDESSTALAPASEPAESDSPQRKRVKLA